MAGTSWLVDSTRIATKIKSASERCDPKKVTWKSNPSRACPNCDHIIDNSDVTQYWPGLPCGVKFDPSDQEIIKHLLAKVGNGNMKSHPFIEEFIPTVDEEDGICYTHPQNLPGVKQDGSVSHFFHRAIKAYNTGTRKRRKIHGDNIGDVRWHKTGRTKPVILDGSQMGCKKIMVLYMSSAKSGKPEKTNWVMHQYHLGTGEDEKEGEFIVSKIFYQQQAKLGDKVEQDLSCDTTEAIIPKVDPVTPKSVIPEPPRAERWQSDVDPGQEHELCVGETSAQNSATMSISEAPVEGTLDDHDDVTEDPKSWAGESQSQFDSQQLGSPYLLTSQQLVEMSLCDDLFRSQPSSGEKDGEEMKDRSGVPAKECQNLDGLDPLNDGGKRMTKPYVTDYVHGMEDPKQGLEHFHNLSQLDFDTPPEFRLSQLDFGSEDSFAWAGSKASD